MKQVKTLLLLSIVIAIRSHSQPFERQVEPFSIAAGGSSYAFPFAGGYNSPQHHFVDIDGDSDLDLFLFDIDQSVDFFRNEGTRLNPNFKLRNGMVTLPRFLVWFQFVDYDGDGLTDLCTEDSMFSGLRVYRNTGTPQTPVFTLFIPTLLDTAGQEVFTGANSIPSFVDIDSDGDLDLFSANITGSANFYKNVGTRSLPRYAYVSGSWQNIMIVGDTCTTSGAASSRSNLHGAAAYQFADIDADGDQDFFVGDLFWNELFMLRNSGTPQVPQMQCFTSHFPQNDPLASTGFNQASFVDIDGDSDLDMFATVLGPNSQRDGFRYYRNQGSAVSHNLRLATKNYISSLDAGMNAHPAFVDIDADGDADMFVGNLNGELAYYRNVGSGNSPAFSLLDSAYLSVPNGFYFSPAFGDIDNDHDLDLFAGMYDGRMKFYRNTGTAQSPQLVLQPFLTDTIDVLNNSTPAVVDIDDDGDLDLFAGGKNGTIRFYRNTGSSSNFIPTLISTTYAGISLGPDTYITPTFADYDSDGDSDLFFGADDGRVEFYENVGSPSSAQFIRRTDRFADTPQAQQTSPALADIEGDGDLDFFVGNRKGGMQFYRNNRVPLSADANPARPETTKLFQCFPNPFNPQTNIAFQIARHSRVTLIIYDVLGRVIVTLADASYAPGFYTVAWNAASQASGVYFYELKTADHAEMKKMLLVR